MPTVLADTFLASLIKLGRGEQKLAAEFVDKFQKDPSNPGISLERVTQTKSKNIWSARVSQGLRAMVQKDGSSWTILYVGHHDDAYDWVSRRTIEHNSHTGSLQIVATPESVEHIFDTPPGVIHAQRIFDHHGDDYLLSLGVPETWLPTIRKVATEDQLLELVQQLPSDVAERLIDLSWGKLVTPPVPDSEKSRALDVDYGHSRFYVIEDSDELLRMLSAPMSKWIGFLHPTQRKLAIGRFGGPVKVTGSAGTGKTVVAMHRARHLARQGKNVLLTSYVGTLCDNIQENLKYLCNNDELSRITVDTVHAQALQIVRSAGERPQIVDEQEIYKLLDQFHWGGCPLDTRALHSEWVEIIQSQAIRTWEQYRDANRRGRGIALAAKDRKLVWQVFEQVIQRFEQYNMCDWSTLCWRALELLKSGKVRSRYNSVIVDEVQDLRPQEIRFLGTMARDERDNLMLLGDSGQRIYGRKISLKSIGVDVRGRSFILKINYRTTAQIRAFAEKLLSPARDDLDEGWEDRSDTKSLLKGPEPHLHGFDTSTQQTEFVIRTISDLSKQGVALNDVAIFARTTDLLAPFEKALKAKRVPYRFLKRETVKPPESGVNLGTMHRAKGLEFKVVFLADVSQNYVPFPAALKQLRDPNDQQDAKERERHLLYVSTTRARDEVYICWVGNQSDFLDPVIVERETALAKR